MPVFSVWVECTSIERFDVAASSFEEAKLLYERGKCSQREDQVQSRDALSIEDESGESRHYNSIG